MDPTTQAAPDNRIRWRHAGREYAVGLDDITIALETECRRETGLAPMAMFGLTKTEMGRDVLAMLVWLARRISGEPAVAHVGRKTMRLWETCTAEMTWQAFGEWEWLGEMAGKVEIEGPLDTESSGRTL